MGSEPLSWHDVALWRAARVAVGVVVPLAVGAATGHLEYGAFASLGALPAGLASFQGVTRTRVAAVVAASVGMAVSTFVGGTVAFAAHWLLVPVVMVWGYVTGLAVCLGPRLSVAVVQWPVALLIAIGMPLSPAEAALRAGLVVAGGLFQGVLVSVSWALQRDEPERAALATSYRSLVTYAAGMGAGPSAPPAPADFPATTRLADPSPLLSTAVRLSYVDLLEQAERLRASLAALGAHADADPSGAASRFIADATRALEAIADALSARPADRARRARELHQTVTDLAVPVGADWQWAAEAMLGQLRAVADILAGLFGTAPTSLPTRSEASTSSAPLQQSEASSTALTLRANLTPAGETGRHALRLAVVTGLAELMVQASGLFEGRWVVLTIFLVLKPDYSSTVYRGIHRSVGTLAGAALGTAVAELAGPGQAGLIIAAAIAVAVAYALFDVNYLLFSGFLTVYIVLLLDILGLPAATTARARLADTAIGAALALIAYALWPTWEGLTAHEKFARLIEAHGRYATSLLNEFTHPGQFDPAQLRRLQTTARRARTDAEASTARLAGEPEHPPLTPAVARTMVAAVTRMAHAELSLHTLVTSDASATVQHLHRTTSADAERIDTLAAALGTTMGSLAGALRSRQPPDGLPPLRRIHAAMRDQSTTPDPRLVTITDRLVDAVDTLTSAVRSASADPDR
ncbi:FUSC family protein [Streptomyces sp. NPDC096040]|uniref:FUSC family protein n=1 Tax=Streptomyces sp. NPDC096040 TaxID=3155541 RepID=UPI00332A163D